MSTLATRQREAHIAFNRFGLGAKRGRFGQIVNDPRGAVLAELNRPAIRLLYNNDGLPNHAQACLASQNGQRSRDIYRAEVGARLRKHLAPDVGFVERLVLFWSNHFHVNAASGGPARSAVGEMERSRIRPNVLGNFRQLLHAVITHPAMIHYLQNGLSVGPNSPFGRQSRRGLNENLGRELLELHTVGVSAGYSQDDVEAAAKVLTGWSIVTPWHGRNRWQGATPQTIGRFIFRANWQEPGAHRVLGRSYGQAGFLRGRTMLNDLAAHPATAQHIAFKLVKHFIADAPTPAMVRPVAQAFLRSDGDLRATYRALVNLPQAWQPELTKLRRPYELFVAQMRALGATWTEPEVNMLLSALGFLSHKPWEWDQPDGFPDDSGFWLTPDAAVTRIAATQAVVRRLLQRRPENVAPLTIARNLLGPNLSPATAAEIRQAGNVFRALTLLLVSPELQKR